MKINNLQINEESLRNLYLKKLSLGEIQGPQLGKASIDKPWLKYYDDSKIISELPQMSMFDYMCKCNENNLDCPALNYYGNEITYRNLIAKVEETAKSFANLGIKDGDVVSIASPYLPEVVYSIYALNKIGAVANMVDPRVPADKLKNYLSKSNSKYLVMLDICYPKVEKIINDTKLEGVISISPTNSLPLPLNVLSKLKELVNSDSKNTNNLISNDSKYIEWKNFINNGKNYNGKIKNNYAVNKPAIIVYTSGTSGEPKGAISSNESFNNMAFFQSDSIINTNQGDKFLLIMPPFIAYGLSIGLHGQLCAGQTLVMVPTFNIDNSAKLLGNLVKKYKPQTVMGVPTFMVDLIKHPAMQKMNCQFLKNLIVGGDSMVPESEELVNSFLESKRSEARISKGWGLTEVNSCFSYTKNRETNEIGSVGVPLLGNNIKIVKPLNEEMDNSQIDIDKLEELPYNTTGEIFISTPTVIIDYLNNKEESKRVFFKSKKTGRIWVRTKDLGRITEDGLIYIDGRMKRIIIRPDGHNISPFAIENIINEHSMVENCVVIGRQSKEHEHGSFAVAYIQLKDGCELYQDQVLEEIKVSISEKLPPRDIASYYEFIDEIPITNIGKVDYKKLEQYDKNTQLQKTLKLAK